MKTVIEFCDTAIDTASYLERMANDEHGALDIFIGKVRRENQNRQVIGIEYEIFAPLAKKTLEELCNKARNEIDDKLDLCIIHRSGYLEVGETSVLIIASSKHRNEAFTACRFMIEEIKHQVPIWKQEHYTDGMSDWVKGHALCCHD